MRFFGLIVLLALRSVAAAQGGSDTSEIVSGAVATDPAQADAAIAELRARGPAGVAALMQHFNGEIQRARAANAEGAAYRATPEWLRIRAALDRISRMKDCYAAGLYWYTDWAAAQEAAREEDKPILTLRLLGNLDDELSCANSRYFRSILYPDPRIAALLRKSFILHWKSVRPVPRLTIDFGDGRRMERTITGNSAHYVVNADGGVVDAIPGLVAPDSFLEVLQQAQARWSGSKTQRLGGPELRAQWQHEADRIARQRETAFAAIGLGVPPPAALPLRPAAAIAAAPLAPTKAAVELRPLAATTPRAEQFSSSVIDPRWKSVAAQREAKIALSPESEALIRTKCATADTATRKIAAFRTALAADTVYNELALRPQILLWLAQAPGMIGVDGLNARVYAELFQTPDDDPWLGLAPEDAYAALENEGFCGVGR